jgi:transposase
VATQRWAEQEIRHGRRGSVVNAYRDLLLGKAVTGVAAGQANKLAAEKNIPVEHAVREMREAMAKKQGEMVRIDAAKKKNSNKPSALLPSPKTGQITLRDMSRRQLAVAYATESVEATRKAKGSPVSSQVAFSLIAKFQDSTKLYITGKRGRPKFKRRDDSVSLQCQITATTPCPLSFERKSSAAGARPGVATDTRPEIKPQRAQAQTKVTLQGVDVPVAEEAVPARAVTRLTSSSASAVRANQENGSSRHPVVNEGEKSPESMVTFAHMPKGGNRSHDARQSVCNQDSTKFYICGKRGRPKFKRREDSVSLQCQITATTPCLPSFEGTEALVDLTRVAGERCNKVPVIFHRPLPAEAKIKRVALTVRNGRYYVTFQVDAPQGAFLREFSAAEGQVLGIDPGRKIALSISSTDGSFTQAVHPPIGRDKRYLKKLRRLQRKLDRQKRQANPECFDEEGRWKKGCRLKVETKGMQATKAELADMARHLVDARTDFYHRTAIDLLQKADASGVGTWRGRGRAPGKGKAKRAQVRKDADHAISEFASILKDKASLSVQPKQVVDVKEPGTTCECPDCGAKTGPSGLEELGVREWTCSSYGTFHIRDFAAARSIARRTAAETAAGRAAGVAEATTPKRKRQRAKAQTKGPSQDGQVPVADEAVAARPAPRQRTPSAASAAVPGQRQGSARASQLAVAQGVSDDVLSGYPRQAALGGSPLAECTAEDSG